MKKVLVGLATLTLVSAILFPVGVAQASFEGRNGKIVFSRGQGPKQGLWKMRPDGTRVTRLTRRADWSAVWSPDGSMIAFLRSTADSSSTHVMVMNRDGSSKRSIGTPSIGEGCGLQPPRWSYDGLFVVYADDCFDRTPRVAQLRIASVVTGDGMDLTDYTSLNGISDQPWSPDLEESQRITFISDRDGDSDVYVMNSDGTEVVQLTTDDDDQFEAIWSPTGQRIAYATQVIHQSGSAQSSIEAIDPDGTNEAVLVAGAPQATEPLWSPNGSLLAATRRTRLGAPTSVVVDATGGNEVVLGKGLNTYAAAWAPDSTALVFAEGDVTKVRLTSDGVTTKALTSGQAYESWIDWQALPN